MTKQEAYARLARSRFRSRFHLTEADAAYIDKKGMETIRRHCADFVAARLAPAEPERDGSQTPMRGHPVFTAQHACACCCRGCLEKWYRVPQHRPLTAEEQRRIVSLLTDWIAGEYERLRGL